MLLVGVRCLQTPGAEWVVIGLTRPSVKRIYWGPLKKLNETLELGLKFNDQELVARFPNGSRIYFVGGETTAEIEKLRGGRFHGAVIDECASYSELVFTDLLHEILQPALNTHRGPLIIIGTPGDVLRGEFYLATCQPSETVDTAAGKRRTNRLFGSDEPPGNWSLHVWTLQDNTAVPHLWVDALAMKERNGWEDDHPVWQREYLGRWVAADTKLVYRYVPHRHDYRATGRGRFGLEEGHDWRTVVGVDLGVRDGTAIVVWAYSDTAPGLWEVYSERRFKAKGEKFPLREFVEWYAEVETQYGPFEAGVGDPPGGGTMVLDTLADEHKIYLEHAEKREKVDHIVLFNQDLDRGLVRILPESTLAAELLTDRWDERKLAAGKREEDRNVVNDTADAALYAWRWCNHRRARPKVAGPQPYTPEWWAALQKAELDAARDAARRRMAGDDDFSRLDAPMEGWL